MSFSGRLNSREKPILPCPANGLLPSLFHCPVFWKSCPFLNISVFAHTQPSTAWLPPLPSKVFMLLNSVVLFQLLSTLNSCHTWQSWISPGQHSPGFASTFVYSITMHLCILSRFSRVRLFVTLRSPPGSSVLGILQTRILEWVAMPSSRGPSRPRNQTCVSLSLTLQVGSWPWGFPGGSTGKESTCNLGGLGSIPGLERSPGEGKGYPLHGV